MHHYPSEGHAPQPALTASPLPPPLFASKQEWRKAGIATKLVQRVVHCAAAAGCRAVYLHVISYNTPAMAFYQRLGFRELALLPDFYVIRQVLQSLSQLLAPALPCYTCSGRHGRCLPPGRALHWRRLLHCPSAAGLCTLHSMPPARKRG
jgi:hypothetical protein